MYYIYSMEYEWDDAKNAANQEKHGIAFESIYSAKWDSALTSNDSRREYGEERFLAYLPIQERLHAVIYVKRGKYRRIISLRKANEREKNYYEQINR
jgi:uncharacterized protein